MGLPTFHKFKKIEPLTHGMTDNKTYYGKKYGTSRMTSRISAFENFLEIEVPPCRESYYIFFIFLILWFPVVFYLLLTHSALTAQLHNQSSKVDLLEIEVLKLMVEVGTLKTQLSFPHDVHKTNFSSISTLIVDESPVKQSQMHLQRLRRSISEDIQSNIRRPDSAPRRTIAKMTSRRGIRAVHFKGAHPEAVVEAGRVGPWNVDSRAVMGNEVSSSFRLREGNESVEIKESGLYLIYGQVYYLTTQPFNSFTISLLAKDSETPVPVALCSTAIDNISSTSEISCFTAAVRTLQQGDRVYLQQREKHRRLIMRGGHTFIGFAKLSSQS